jgi:hypothetical protein
MFRSFRPFPFLFLFTFLFAVSHTSTGRASATDAVRLTAAANVTVRLQPESSSSVVAQVPLGTELVDTGPAGLDKTWVRVSLADGREGWVLSNLTRPLDRNWPWPAFDAIIADRLGRKGDAFPALVELIAFIERVTPQYTDPDGRARVEFARLRAMSAAAKAIPFRGGSREPYASWLKARGAQVVYDEPGGKWMLTARTIWETQNRIESAAIADEVAWFAVTNGLGGECEGRLACYFDRRNRLHGEYLRIFPNGRHAAEAVGIVKDTADQVSAPAKPAEAFRFDRSRDCRDVMTTLDALTAAIQATRVSQRDAAIASLGSVRRVCQ